MPFTPECTRQTEAWVRPELYFGIVKVVMKDGAVMALVAYGAGAKSSNHRDAAGHGAPD